jgi:large subunit ribosomal protein L25
MHENAPTLKAKTREKLGTRYSARVRSAGGLPAVVYGRGREPLAVTLEAKDTLSHISKGEKVFRLEFGNGSTDSGQTVLLKEIQFDHLGTQIVHADFARVSLEDRVVVRVPVHLIGEAKGLKNAGAILMHPTSELEVECAVKDIPEFVEVQIGELDLDHAITASEVKLAPGIKLKTDPKAMVAQIVIQQEIVEEKAEAGTVEGEAAAEPEVITAKKKEGEEGEAAAAAPGAKGAAPGAKAPAAGAAKAPAAGAAKAPAAGAKPAAPAGGDKKK